MINVINADSHLSKRRFLKLLYFWGHNQPN
jgi:hypothetical protein